MVPEHHRVIARHIADRWQVRPRVESWSADGTSHEQAVAAVANWPQPGASAFSTIGLSDHGGAEIAATALTRNQSFVKIIFDVASYIAAGDRIAEPGAVFEKGVDRYYSRCQAGHLLLTDIAPPDLGLPDVATDTGTVRWLYAVPITTDELVFMNDHGYPALVEHLRSTPDETFRDLDRATLPAVPRLDPWS